MLLLLQISMDYSRSPLQISTGGAGEVELFLEETLHCYQYLNVKPQLAAEATATNQLRYVN